MSEQLKYSLPFGGAIILTTLSMRIDKLIVNRYISIEDFAIYSVAFFSIPFVSELIQSTQSVLVPKLSLYLIQGDVSKASRLWKYSVTAVASINIPFIIFFGIMAEPLFTVLYTKNYSQAYVIFRAFIFVNFFHIFLRGVVLRACKKTKTIFKIDIICLPIIVISAFLLIKQFGIWGAVVSTIIGNLLPILFRVLIEKKILELSFKNWIEWNKLYRIIFSSVFPAIILLILKSLIDSNIIFLLFSFIFYFTIVFFIEYKLDVFMFKNELKSLKDRILLIF